MKRTNENDNSKAAIRNILLKVYGLKYFYIICVALALISGHLYNKYTNKTFEVTASIAPVKDNKSTLLRANDLFGGLGVYPQKKSDVEDDINSLSSYSLVAETVNSLNLEVGYFMKNEGFFDQTTETYIYSPFIITIDKSHNQPLYSDFHVTLLNDSIFKLTLYEKEATIYNYIDNAIISEDAILKFDSICKFNRTISNKYFKFSISRNNDFFPDKISPKETYYFTLYHPDMLSREYLSKIKVQPLSYSGSLIKINFRGENISKAINFLNKYIDNYLENNLEKKNKQSVSTINFIDSQISEISDSLVISESRLKNFRSANQVMDLSFQGQRSYEQLAQIEADRNNLEQQSRYYNYVINYFKTKQDMSGMVPPISANISDPIMNQLVSDLIILNDKRSGLSNQSEKNLFLGQIENQIEMKKRTILENVTSNLSTLNITRNELDYRYDKLSREISNLPKTELNMVNIQRKFNLNETIYTYLLQKRSEAAITLASNYPDFEILEPARTITSKIVKPNSMKTYLLLLFIGFLIPTALLFTRELFNNNISSVYDVERMIDHSVLGVIYSNKYKYESVVMKSPSSVIAESFRNLRSNVFTKLKSKKPKIILTTSSQPQDGKSFVTFNLAASIASVGYKTVIIDCDLRRPTLHLKFGTDNRKGVSTFITNSTSLKDVINKTDIENLHFISAGPLLPNPSELIDAGALDELINIVSSEYDYVIIDTSPIGLVADSLQLVKYATYILVVTRNNYTRKDVFASALDILESNNIADYDVIINDINLKRSPYSSYTDYYIKEKH